MPRFTTCWDGIACPAPRGCLGRCSRDAIRKVPTDEGERCDAYLAHGPGHQSKSRCEVRGPHDVHETHYHGGQRARWKDGSYTDRLRARGIEFSPTSYPENMAMTGYFDEPPLDPEEER